MRDIKFRVWNGTDMVHDVTTGRFGTFYVNPGTNGDGLNPKDIASLTPFTTRYGDHTPVMQYTGLKDHQGTEIYESDIILWVDEEGGLQHYLVEWGEEDGTWWADGQWLAELLPVVTVVGNQYENPRLLEAKS